MTTRTLVLVAPHWSTVAAGVADRPAAIVHANRVVEVSPPALAHGVGVGLRRREAQARCPALEVLDHDPARDARWFEPVVAALETLTPRVEILRPGHCAFPTRGPSRYFGGDEALAALAAERVDGAIRDIPGADADALAPRVGIADGLFGAGLAAVHLGPRRIRVVEPGHSPDYLRGFPISALGEGTSPLPEPDELIDLLWRLGLSRLGDLAELPAEDLLARFGQPGVVAHRLASGLDERPPDTRPIPPDLVVSAELDPPAERVDTAAFVAKTLADQLDTRLARDGVACTRIVIEAETEHGESLARCWRHEGVLSPSAITDRVRWQLDGWLHSPRRPTGGIALLRLVPDEIVPDEGRQLGFWGGQTQADERAIRAIARIQGLLGPDAVTVPEVAAGRRPVDHEGRAPVTGVELGPDRPLARPGVTEGPWPGRLPTPSPARVLGERRPVVITDPSGEPVTVDGRGHPSGEPVHMARPGAAGVAIDGWAGPWPLDERWWDDRARRRQARLQVVLADGSAHLVAIEAGQWWLEATYD